MNINKNVIITLSAAIIIIMILLTGRTALQKRHLANDVQQLQQEIERKKQEKVLAAEEKIQREKAEAEARKEILSMAEDDFIYTIEVTGVDYISEYRIQVSLSDVNTVKDNAQLETICNAFQQACINARRMVVSVDPYNYNMSMYNNDLFQTLKREPSDAVEKKLIENITNNVVVFGTNVGLHTAGGKSNLIQAVKNEFGCSFRIIVSAVVGWDSSGGNLKRKYKVLSDHEYSVDEVKDISKRQMEICGY